MTTKWLVLIVLIGNHYLNAMQQDPDAPAAGAAAAAVDNHALPAELQAIVHSFDRTAQQTHALLDVALNEHRTYATILDDARTRRIVDRVQWGGIIVGSACLGVFIALATNRKSRNRFFMSTAAKYAAIGGGSVLIPAIIAGFAKIKEWYSYARRRWAEHQNNELRKTIALFNDRMKELDDRMKDLETRLKDHETAQTDGVHLCQHLKTRMQDLELNITHDVDEVHRLLARCSEQYDDRKTYSKRINALEAQTAPLAGLAGQLRDGRAENQGVLKEFARIRDKQSSIEKLLKKFGKHSDVLQKLVVDVLQDREEQA